MPLRLELIKIVASGVVVERDSDGNVVGEHQTDPVALYNVGQIHDYFATLSKNIAEQSAAMEAASAEAAGAPQPNRAARRARGGKK